MQYHWQALLHYPATHAVMLWQIGMAIMLHRYFHQQTDLLIRLYDKNISLLDLYHYLLNISIFNKIMGGHNLPFFAQSGFAQNLLLAVYIGNNNPKTQCAYVLMIMLILLLSYHTRGDEQVWRALRNLGHNYRDHAQTQNYRLRRQPQNVLRSFRQTASYLWRQSRPCLHHLYEASNLIKLAVRIDSINIMNDYGKPYVQSVRHDIENMCHAAYFRQHKANIPAIQRMAEIYSECSIRKRASILQFSNPRLAKQLISDLRKQALAQRHVHEIARFRESSLTLVQPYVLEPGLHRLIRSYLKADDSNRLNHTAKSLFR